MKKTFIISSLIAALFATPSFAAPTELDKKTVASKAYVDTKQDIIETGLVDYYSIGDDETYQVPSLLSYDSTNGLTGTQIGILNWGYISNDGWNELTGSEMDNFVPTVRAVANSLDRLFWGGGEASAVNAYSTTFDPSSTHVDGNWPYQGGTKLVTGRFLAYSLALKQNKIPAGTAGNVVTYSGTAGTVGSVATANAPTYNETTGVLENGTNIATIAAVDTRQKKMTCAGWDSETHTDEHCWLWSIE